MITHYGGKYVWLSVELAEFSLISGYAESADAARRKGLLDLWYDSE